MNPDDQKTTTLPRRVTAGAVADPRQTSGDAHSRCSGAAQRVPISLCSPPALEVAIASEQRTAIATADGYVRREIARAGVHAVVIVTAYFVLPFGESWFFGGVLAFTIVGLFPFTIRRFGRVLRSRHPLGDASARSS